MTARVVCSECGEPIQARDVRARLGPGYPPDTPPPGRRVELGLSRTAQPADAEAAAASTASASSGRQIDEVG